ncbi:hypothetical protein BAZSYMB_SCAFFOLD00028_9 [Bathymodiolus azoricus thioautotrophic gill symbiont]|uniref:Uncharacterized protein n=1 Tax=Bathymodiolus azoricus thioautotrophic gill symbiont TaxID=235205 RepID=A0A1H6KMD8_9GAMM|nr:hypothetical protein BAZSYMB_SCAFFOLD00028_9 [Bathymodiolus azoricus thioautotrophic gill symbiont]
MVWVILLPPPITKSVSINVLLSPLRAVESCIFTELPSSSTMPTKTIS